MHQEIILPASELKAALPGLNKIIGRSRTLPVLTAVKVARDDSGQVTLQATDLDSFATYTLKEAQPGPTTALLLPLEHLTRNAKGLSAEDTITLVVQGKERVKLRCAIGGSVLEQSLRTFAVEEWPVPPKVSQPATPLEPGFGLAFKQALECRSTDPTRANINGVFLDVTEPQSPCLVSTNGQMLFCANSFRVDLTQSLIIPDSKFLEWTDLLEQTPCSLSVKPGQAAQPAREGQPATPAQPAWVKFESPRWTFVTQEVEGKFPAWRHTTPEMSSLATLIELSGEAIRQMLQIIPRFPGDESPNHPVRLRVDWHYLMLEGQAKEEREWTSVSIQNVRVTGRRVPVVLNRQYLVKALRFGLKQLEVEDELCPVLFSSGGKKLVIMPINLEGTPAVVPVTPPPQSAQGETQKVAA